MKKILKGHLFHRVETLGDKKYKHVGFEDDQGEFGNLLEDLVPEEGMNKRARITIELLEE